MTEPNELILHFRVRAMYAGHRIVLVIVTIAFCVEFAINIWLGAHGIRKKLC
jgi:hypothetical protein